MNRVFKVSSFEKECRKQLCKAEIKELDKFIEDLKQDSNRGKPLGYEFLREKKISGKRVYFLTYKEVCVILLVAISNKKTQQATIKYIKTMIPEYRKYINKLL